MFGIKNAKFQSTRPVRGATTGGAGAPPLFFISIHAPRAGRDHPGRSRRNEISISIHAPRAGRDCAPYSPQGCSCYFNPRAPCGARLAAYVDLGDGKLLFQSTRPVRGATRTAGKRETNHAISIHAPRAGRDFIDNDFKEQNEDISIHAPRAGRDKRMYGWLWDAYIFQSTRPVRGATLFVDVFIAVFMISIHAPRAGRDDPDLSLSGTSEISIHAPRAGRDLDALKAHRRDSAISIHAPRAGRDILFMLFALVRKNFNPRAPCGARR